MAVMNAELNRDSVVCLPDRRMVEIGPHPEAWKLAGHRRKRVEFQDAQCIKRLRFGTIWLIREETNAWYTHSNDRHCIVDWRMTIGDTRIKLKSIYPEFSG